MAIRQVNQFSVGDVNFTSMMETLNKSYKGKADITLSNYDNDSAPVVKVGSLFDCNGSIILVETADETPTGYSGISISTTFYLVYDESAAAFIYSSSAPTWNDALQGWYVGTDRYLYSMYKDSGGTLYQDKTVLRNPNVMENVDIGNDLTVGGDITGATLSTGHGANELYGMDQDVKTTTQVVFDGITINTYGIKPKLNMGTTIYAISSGNYYTVPRGLHIYWRTDVAYGFNVEMYYNTTWNIIYERPASSANEPCFVPSDGSVFRIHALTGLGLIGFGF